MTSSSGVICARPKVRARTAAGVQACRREPTQRQRLAVGAPNFLWTIKPLQNRTNLASAIPPHTTDKSINQNCADHQLVSVNERLACRLCHRTHYGIGFSMTKTQLFSSVTKLSSIKERKEVLVNSWLTCYR